MARRLLYKDIEGCKHGKVDNSWSLQSLSENDSKLYVDFEFRGKPNCKHLKKHIDLLHVHKKN